MDLEVARADRRHDPRRLAARLGERARDLGLARAVEAQDAVLGRLGVRENALHRVGLERARPEPLQLRRRARQDDHDGVPRAEHEARRRAREPERDRALGQRRLLAHARLEVRVRPLQPLRDRTRDLADLGPQRLVDVQRQAGGARDELHGAVVVRRAEAARDDAEVRLQPYVERGLELPLVVADDRDRRGLEPEAHELAREEGPVAVGAVAAHELAARDDESATQTERCRAR